MCAPDAGISKTVEFELQGYLRQRKVEEGRARSSVYAVLRRDMLGPAVIVVLWI